MLFSLFASVAAFSRPGAPLQLWPRARAAADTGLAANTRALSMERVGPACVGPLLLIRGGADFKSLAQDGARVYSGTNVRRRDDDQIGAPRPVIVGHGGRHS